MVKNTSSSMTSNDSNHPSKTIIGISTPVGTGAICIVRISGKQALPITLSLSKRDFLKPRYATLSFIYDEANRPIDEAILLYFKAPHSYSGEDICEIQCHGGVLIGKTIIQRALDLGATLARPGEFTKRAFLNGKLDFAQAQAICALINSQSTHANEILLRQLRGELSEFVAQVRAELIEILAYSEVSIDYSEELESSTSMLLSQKLLALRHKLAVLHEDSKHRQGVIEGFRICIIGKPNVGKSSLLNALLASPRAITSSIPGTTRDIIEESLSVGGQIVRLVDTAGIRDSYDEIEQIGIQRSYLMLDSANIILALFDSSAPLTSEDRTILDILSAQRKAHILLLLTKADISRDSSPLLEDFSHPLLLSQKPLKISATHGKQEEFSEFNPQQIFTLLEEFLSTQHSFDGLMLTSSFQIGCVKRALDSIDLARTKLEELELFSFHINECINAICAITEPFEHSQMLDKMFSEFCLGK
ncbi:MAG: tRNA uridine-5-carboxymethylaminomethyl(34) synthesis GTPase MnmE [Helicobacter sp.]|nr:tRNA uridine-5-carboxymethylaminomethyl(34) synthesis GTPase MnmE [Helicobacter sp.]